MYIKCLCIIHKWRWCLRDIFFKYIKPHFSFGIINLECIYHICYFSGNMHCVWPLPNHFIEVNRQIRTEPIGINKHVKFSCFFSSAYFSCVFSMHTPQMEMHITADSELLSVSVQASMSNICAPNVATYRAHISNQHTHTQWLTCTQKHIPTFHSLNYVHFYARWKTFFKVWGGVWGFVHESGGFGVVWSGRGTVWWCALFLRGLTVTNVSETHSKIAWM